MSRGIWKARRTVLLAKQKSFTWKSLLLKYWNHHPAFHFGDLSEFSSPPLRAALPGREGLHCRGEAAPERSWRQQATPGGRKAPRQRAACTAPEEASVVCAMGCHLALTSAAALPPVTHMEEAGPNLHHEAGTTRSSTGAFSFQLRAL